MKEHEQATKNKPESKPGSKPNAKDDLKSLPMPEVEKKLGSSPDGLSQDEAQKRLTQYGPNEIEEKKTNPFLKFLTRTRGPFWSHRPARILWGAVFGTQIAATLIAVYGLFMTPLAAGGGHCQFEAMRWCGSLSMTVRNCSRIGFSILLK